MSTETEQPVGADDLTTALVEFSAGTPGVSETVVVSADGFALAGSATETGPGVEQLAAVISGLSSLTRGTSELYQLGEVRRIIVDMAGGYLFVVSTGAGCNIGTVTDTTADLGNLGYQLTVLSQRLVTLLTPDRIDSLKNVISPRP